MCLLFWIIEQFECLSNTPATNTLFFSSFREGQTLSHRSRAPARRYSNPLSLGAPSCEGLPPQRKPSYSSVVCCQCWSEELSFFLSFDFLFVVVVCSKEGIENPENRVNWNFSVAVISYSWRTRGAVASSRNKNFTIWRIGSAECATNRVLPHRQ